MRAARKDGPHRDIVDALEAVGASVSILEPRGEAPGLPDLLVGFRGTNTLLEVKDPKGRLSIDQETWHGCWRGDKPWVVSCVQQALVAIGAAERPSTLARRARVAKLGIRTRGPRLVSSRRPAFDVISGEER